MSYMVPKLKQRIQIQSAEENSTDDGGFEMSYTTIISCWSEIRPINDYIRAVRGTQTEEKETHVFRIRKIVADDLGAEFDSAFDTDLNAIDDLNTIKSQYFIFLEKGSSTKGRRFRIRGTQVDDNFSEYIKIWAEEINEEGTGYQV